MSIKTIAWRHLPLSALKLAVRAFGSFEAHEQLGLVRPPWYVYGMLAAAKHARAVGVKSIWGLEFGVATGRGLRQLVSIGAQITDATGVNFRIAGFDTGRGMPPSSDYRDHPEKYREGDYPMLDQEKLRADLRGKAELILGDIDQTVDGFRAALTPETPVGFVAVDVDIYSSAKATLRIFEGAPNLYLPMTFTYFDDCANRSHFTRFAGELLAIEEFNAEHVVRKLDIDRGIWNSHRKIGQQLWYQQMYILHVFDHAWRTAAHSRCTKLIQA